MRIRWLAPIAVSAIFAATAAARELPPPDMSARVSPAAAGASGDVSLSAAFDGAARGELQGLEIDLAHGFAFNARGVAAMCDSGPAGRDSCPPGSRIGSGTGRIAVQGSYLPRTEYEVALSLYETAPRRAGDLAGALLDLDQPQSALSVALRGRVVAIAHGTYGLALRFSQLAGELPSGFDLTLTDVQIRLGADAFRAGKVHSLLTDPPSCSHAGWPLAITIHSGSTIRTDRTAASCSGHR